MTDPQNPKQALIEMAQGYWRSRVLCAAARLGIADQLGEEGATLADLATACRSDVASLHRLLRALASFGIVSESLPGHFVLTPKGAPLRKTAPDSAWAPVVFWGDLLADSWSRMTDCVRTGDRASEIMKREGVASRWANDPDAPGIFRAVMGTGAPEDYLPLVRAWDFTRAKIVADLGGGGGSLILAILREFPGVRGMLVDQPDSIERARDRFANEPRCSLVAADLRRGVPAGADVYVLKHVLHGYADDDAVEILRNCAAALPTGGRCLVIEFVLPDLSNQVDAAIELRAMSDLNMLAVTGGKERSAAEWRSLLARAGLELRDISRAAGEPASIIEAGVQRA